MDKLTMFLSFLAALSLATERTTEMIKGLPILSLWFAVERKSGSTLEEFRKATIHIVAIIIGTGFAWLTRDQLSTALGMPSANFWIYLLFGAMASGGSGLWNSALDIVREVNKQKQIMTDKMKTG